MACRDCCQNFGKIVASGRTPCTAVEQHRFYNIAFAADFLQSSADHLGYPGGLLGYLSDEVTLLRQEEGTGKPGL